PRDGVAESKRPIRFLQVAFPDSSTGLHGPGANLMHTAMVGNEYEVVFRIQSYSVRVREQSVFALEKPDGRVFGFGRLLECYHCAVVLNREQKFLALLIHGYAKGSVGSVELTFGTYIPLGLTRKDYQRIYRVVIHRVNIPIFGVNIDTTLELDLGLQSANGALRLGYAGRRGIIQSVVDQNIEQVFVRENYFVLARVHRDRAIRGIAVANHAHRFFSGRVSTGAVFHGIGSEGGADADGWPIAPVGVHRPCGQWIVI